MRKSRKLQLAVERGFALDKRVGVTLPVFEAFIQECRGDEEAKDLRWKLRRWLKAAQELSFPGESLSKRPNWVAEAEAICRLEVCDLNRAGAEILGLEQLEPEQPCSTWTEVLSFYFEEIWQVFCRQTASWNITPTRLKSVLEVIRRFYEWLGESLQTSFDLDLLANPKWNAVTFSLPVVEAFIEANHLTGKDAVEPRAWLRKLVRAGACYLGYELNDAIILDLRTEERAFAAFLNVAKEKKESQAGTPEAEDPWESESFDPDIQASLTYLLLSKWWTVWQELRQKLHSDFLWFMRKILNPRVLSQSRQWKKGR